MVDRTPVHYVASDPSSDNVGPFIALRNMDLTTDRIKDVVHRRDFDLPYTMLVKQGSGEPVKLDVGAGTLVGRGVGDDIQAYGAGAGLAGILGTGTADASTFLNGLCQWTSIPSAIGEINDISDVNAPTPLDRQYFRANDNLGSIEWIAGDLEISDDKSPTAGGNLNMLGFQLLSTSDPVTIVGNSGTTSDTLSVDSLLTFSTNDGQGARPVMRSRQIPGGGIFFDERIPIYADSTGMNMGFADIQIRDIGDGDGVVNIDGFGANVKIDGVDVAARDLLLGGHLASAAPHAATQTTGGTAHATLVPDGASRTAGAGRNKIHLRELADNPGVAGEFLRSDGQWGTPTGSGGGVDTLVDVGSGVGVTKQVNGSDAEFKSLTVNTSPLTIAASGANEVLFTYNIDSLSEEANPASGDWFLMQDAGGTFLKVDSDNMPGSGGSGATDLDGLDDVTITGSLANGQYLRGNGTVMVNTALEIEDDKSPVLGADLDLGGFDITSSQAAQITTTAGDLNLRTTGSGGEITLRAETGPVLSVGNTATEFTWGSDHVASIIPGGGSVNNRIVTKSGDSDNGTLKYSADMSANAGRLQVFSPSSTLQLLPVAGSDVKLLADGEAGSVQVRGSAPRIYSSAAADLVIENTSTDQNVDVQTAGTGTLTVNGTPVTTVTTPATTVVNAVPVFGDTAGSDLTQSPVSITESAGVAQITNRAGSSGMDISATAGELTIKGAPVITTNITGQQNGDLIVADGTSSWVNFGHSGASPGDVLTIASSGTPDLEWASPAAAASPGDLQDLDDVVDSLGTTHTAGQILVGGGASDTFQKLSIGAANSFLRVNAGLTALEWWDGGATLSAIGGLGVTSGNLILANGSTWTALATGTENQVLQGTGTSMQWVDDITLKGELVSASGTDGNINLNPDGTGDVTIELNSSTDIMRFHLAGTDEVAMGSEEHLYLQAGYGNSSSRDIVFQPSVGQAGVNDQLELSFDPSTDRFELECTGTSTNLDLLLTAKGDGTVMLATGTNLSSESGLILKPQLPSAHIVLDAGEVAGAGEVRISAAGTGDITLDTNNGDVRIEGNQAVTMVSGASAPSITDGSVRWFNTSAGHNEWYMYDTDRSRWLSERAVYFSYGAAGTKAAGGYVNGTNGAHDTQASGGQLGSGYVTNEKLVVCTIDYCGTNANIGGASSGFKLQSMTADGATVTDIGSAHTVGLARTARFEDLDDAVDGDAAPKKLVCLVDGDDLPDHHWINVMCRREA